MTAPRLHDDQVVVQLRIRESRVGLTAPFITAVRRADDAHLVVIEAVDAAGRSGFGEAAISWRVTGESPASVIAAVQGPLSDVVIGRAPGDPSLADDLRDAIWGNAAARSAVECAITELAAVQAGQSLWARLGATTPTIRTDRTLSAAAPLELARAAVEHVAEGFDVLKIKVRAGDETVAGLREVRSAVGDAIALRVDANQAWTSEEAIQVVRDVERAGILLEFIEQPVPALDLAGLAAVAAAVDTPVMADESVRTERDVRAVVEGSTVALVNIKLAKTGGLTEAHRAAATAIENGLKVVVGCMLEGPVGITAAASFAAAVAPDAVHDLDGAHWLVEPPMTPTTATFNVDVIELPSLEAAR